MANRSPVPSSAPSLAHVRDWVFDLDNTLYPATCDLFAQIDVRMTEFVSSLLNLPEGAARAVQKHYYSEHGTTLNGLMLHHGLEPAEFLDYVHDIDLSPVLHSEALCAAMAALPGRKFVYTNGSRGHADQVMAKLKIDHLFDGVFAIEDSDYTPKPHQASFDRFVAEHNIVPSDAAFFEDLARNLEPAHAMGFVTVLVHSTKDWSHEPEGARPASTGDDAPHFVHYVTDNLTAFLETAISGNRSKA
ncbi:MAG: pyrimidine 5'-nucleotidase [Hyphomonadaceae bacterium]